MEFQWVIFDADRTLFDYDAAEAGAVAQAFADFALPFSGETRAAYRQINEALWREFEQGSVSIGDLRVLRFERLFAATGLKGDCAAMSERYLGHLAEGSQLYPEVESVLARIGARKVIMTNGISAVQRRRFEKSGLARFIEALIISEEVGHAKPHPGIFEHAFEQMGRPDKDSVLMVGDSLSSDIRGGRDYGIATCWLNPEGLPRTDGIEPTWEIRSLTELLELPLRYRAQR